MRYTLLIILTVLIIAGCSLGGQQVSSGRDIKVTLTDLPQEKIYEGEQFSMEAEVENRGVEELSGQLCVQDTPSERFGGIPDEECRLIRLDAAQTIDEEPQAEVATELFGPYSYQDLQKDIAQSTTLSAKFTYDLTTTAGTQLCTKNPAIKEEDLPIDCPKEETIRDITQRKTPIEVTEIKKQTMRIDEQTAKLILDITLEQTEDGKVIAQGTEKPQIEFEVAYTQPLICRNIASNAIEWDNKKFIAHCETELPFQEREFIQDPLTIRLSYSFEKRIASAAIELRKE